ncbi:MAG: helix-turn-helix domain-containing protein [Clostridia bacterium]|nr:helix-turn-helix domain-containing protein [Clostridia bacterium]
MEQTKATKKIILSLDNQEDHESISKVSHALSAPERVRIMQAILSNSKSLSALSMELDLPISSVSRHVDVLEQAGLIDVRYQPGLKGHTKFCSAALLNYSVNFRKKKKDDPKDPAISVELPVGMFSHCHINAPCGMTGISQTIETFDDPNVFFSPSRIEAECLWFDWGSLTYNFPAKPLLHHRCREISFSFEICSNTVYFNEHWPSDITVTVNKTEVLTFTSPGDFGGKRGKYTPEYWPLTSSQFGLLKKITINGTGVYLDGSFVHNSVRFEDLDLYNGNAVSLKIEVKKNAEHRGGVNLFGKNFGDHPQAIVMTVK